MASELMGYQGRMDSPVACCAKPASMLERMKSRRDEIDRQLAQINEAIDKLEANPDVAETLEAISKVGGLY